MRKNPKLINCSCELLLKKNIFAQQFDQISFNKKSKTKYFELSEGGRNSLQYFSNLTRLVCLSADGSLCTTTSMDEGR